MMTVGPLFGSLLRRSETSRLASHFKKAGKDRVLLLGIDEQ